MSQLNQPPTKHLEPGFLCSPGDGDEMCPKAAKTSSLRLCPLLGCGMAHQVFTAFLVANLDWICSHSLTSHGLGQHMVVDMGQWISVKLCKNRVGYQLQRMSSWLGIFDLMPS